MNAETIQHLSAAGKILGRLIRKVGPCTLRPERNCSPFQSLVRSVAYQQLTGKAGRRFWVETKICFLPRNFRSPPVMEYATIDPGALAHSQVWTEWDEAKNRLRFFFKSY